MSKKQERLIIVGLTLFMIFVFGYNYYHEWKKAHREPLTTEQYERMTQFADSLTRDSMKIKEMNEVCGFAVGDERVFHLFVHTPMLPSDKIRLLSVYQIKRFEYDLCETCNERMELYLLAKNVYECEGDTAEDNE